MLSEHAVRQLRDNLTVQKKELEQKITMARVRALVTRDTTQDEEHEEQMALLQSLVGGIGTLNRVLEEDVEDQTEEEAAATQTAQLP